MHGKLYIVATPIGNLEDITLRAIRVLKEVGAVFAEDTRMTRKLLSHYDIHNKVLRLDARTETSGAGRVVEELRSGKDVAFVTDAGTPCISDPGARLVKSVREGGFSIVSVPGPSALAAALSISGVYADEFVFYGFPPHKKGRETFFKNIGGEKRTIIFFESPHRIMKALSSLTLSLKGRRVVLLRELTKVYEEVVSGTAEEVLNFFESHPDKVRGEFVVVAGRA